MQHSHNETPDRSMSNTDCLVPSPPEYHIIGDVYVDILCYIPSSPSLNHDHSTTSTSLLKLDGTDTALTEPITIMAGGSTINTATYLQYLQQSVSSSSFAAPSLDITVHTVFNPNDYYGSILLQHSQANHITLHNGYSDDIFKNHNTDHRNNEMKTNPQNRSTPHCMVMISSSSTTTATPSHTSNEFPTSSTTTTTTTLSSERTFLTHRGCATDYMCLHNLFPSPAPMSLHSNHTSSSTMVRPLHYHIAGYYCTPEFWNTTTTTTTTINTDTTENSLLSFVKNIFHESTTISKENGWSHSNMSSSAAHATSPITTGAPIILSLVTQYDATQQWDIYNLSTILPYMHICIMNELEAQQIYSSNIHKENSPVHEKDNGSLLSDIISFFTKFNPSTIYVITQGVKGAIAFRHQTIMAQVFGTVNVTSIVAPNSDGHNHENGMGHNTTTNYTTTNNNVIIDPTGAGDAFCAGFFHSLWQSIQCTTVPTKTDSSYRPSEQYWPQAATIQDALLYGCTVGTCSVLQRGGSTVPASDHNLVPIIHEQYQTLCPPILSNGISPEHQ